MVFQEAVRISKRQPPHQPDQSHHEDREGGVLDNCGRAWRVEATEYTLLVDYCMSQTSRRIGCVHLNNEAAEGAVNIRNIIICAV